MFSGKKIDLSPSSAVVKYRFSKTHNGIQFDIAKSALQKYIRRGETNKAIYFAVECLLFYHIGGGQSNYTNTINRIRVIFLEDIGIANPYMITFVDKCICGYPAENKKLTQKKIKEDTNGLWNSSDVIPNLIATMCSSPKYRFYSHSKFIDYKGKRDIETLEDIFKTDKGINNAAPIIFDLFSSNKQTGIEIINLVEKYSKGKSHKKEIQDIIIVCRKWLSVMNVKETYLVCDHVVFSYFYRDSLFWSNETEQVKNASSYIKKNLDRKIFDVDDYVQDRHTASGRTEKTTNFAVEGSLVSYEDAETILVVGGEKIKHLYIENRLKSDTILKESELFKFKVRSQLTCSKYRPDVYFASLGNNKNVVVKGPFLSFDDVYESYNLFRIMELFSNGGGCVNYMKYITIKIAYPDMFFKNGKYDIPFGERLKVNPRRPSYFLVMEDLFSLDIYPETIKSGTKWPQTKVVDYEKVTSGGFPSNKSIENLKRCISFIHQLIFRCIFSLGDFAARNFIYRGNRVWNIDCDRITKNKMDIRWSAKMKKIVRDTFIKNRKEILHPWKFFLSQKTLWIKLENILSTNIMKENLIGLIRGDYDFFPAENEKSREIQSLVIKIIKKCSHVKIDMYNIIRYINDEEFFQLIKTEEI